MFLRRVITKQQFLRQRRLFCNVSGEKVVPPVTVTAVTDTLLQQHDTRMPSDAIELCEVGWSHHQGLIPDSEKSVDIAIEHYVKSVELGYAPAATLLGDIYYFDHEGRKDWSLATMYLQDVVRFTRDPDSYSAYDRINALQKLGVIATRGVSEGEETVHFHAPNKKKGLMLFKDALALCETYFGCSWPFLLAHDPLGLQDHLVNEENLLGDAEVLGRVMSDLVSTGQGREGDESALSQLQYYTRALRKLENDPLWVAQWQTEVLEEFPVGSKGGEWGVTFFSSFLRIFMEPIVQHAVSTGRGGVPKVVSLGSGLGNAVTWPALAFGFRGVGLDVIPSCTKGATELYTASVEAIKRRNSVLDQYRDSQLRVGQPLPAAGNDALIGKVVFDCVDVLSDKARVAKELSDANVVWLQDECWSVEAQRDIEATALASMPSGTIMVLYRPPHHPPANSRLVKAIPVATSWNPTLSMYIVYKE